ncbi:CGNR zinc finger domain-containing protein [Kribbella sp. DT2]|uniref:CGNR zinc finger domain-containing protein n=1 Tax=Kribbella sp. DT2 TaxID=3393427 RepID=UPI003CF716F8
MSSEYDAAEPLVVGLMNTVRFEREEVQDALAPPAGAAAWLDSLGTRIQVEAGTTGVVDLDDTDLTSRLRDLRDALRTLAAEVTDDPRPAATAPALTRADAIAQLNALARTWPELTWPADGEPTRAFRTAGPPADLVVGLIAHQGVELLAGPDRERLRACLAPNCLLFFYKRQTRRDWCSAQCGNRARVARHYQRHHARHD